MWWIKQRVLDVDRWWKNFDWDEFWKILLLTLLTPAAGFVVTLPVGAFTGTLNGPFRPFAVEWIIMTIPTAFVIYWIGYGWWRKIVEWARTGEKVIEKLNGR